MCVMRGFWTGLPRTWTVSVKSNAPPDLSLLAHWLSEFDLLNISCFWRKFGELSRFVKLKFDRYDVVTCRLSVVVLFSYTVVKARQTLRCWQNVCAMFDNVRCNQGCVSTHSLRTAHNYAKHYWIIKGRSQNMHIASLASWEQTSPHI